MLKKYPVGNICNRWLIQHRANFLHIIFKKMLVQFDDCSISAVDPYKQEWKVQIAGIFI